MRASWRMAGVSLAALALAGCGNLNTQISTLKPVEGDQITGLNIAVNDVLLQQKVPILVAPVCTFSAGTYDCLGKTLNGQEIKATAAGEAETFTVTVGGKQVFSGATEDVLVKAGQQ